VGGEVSTGSTKWLKGAVIGSTWAALEIIAGSFLHNLHIPFAGTLLSMASVFLLVAFMTVWKERGIILRAGLVCALMKSISPSAIILGPMAGIFMEALLLETVVFLAGRHLVAYILAGGLAVLWALVQKVVHLLIIYGFDLVRIAESFYEYLVQLTGWSELQPLHLAVLVASFYLIAGFLAALSGFAAGTKRQPEPGTIPSFGKQADQQPASVLSPEPTSHAALLLPLLTGAMIGSLILLERDHTIPALVAGSLLIIFILVRYRSPVRSLKKPAIWIQFTVVTLLATFLWSRFSAEIADPREGFLAGLAMVFRALVVLFSFSAISTELRNPVVKSLLYRNGFAPLYRSLRIAFLTTPHIIASLPQFKNLFRQRGVILATLLTRAEELYHHFSKEANLHSHIFIATNSVRGGKTTFAGKLAEKARSAGWKTEGIISRGTFSGGKRHCFITEIIGRGPGNLLATTEPQEGWVRYRRFWFDPQVFQQGIDAIATALEEGPDLVILDEVGPLEMHRKGWYPLMKKALEYPQTIQVWTVRRSLAYEVADSFFIPRNNVIDLSSAGHERAADRILKELRREDVLHK